MSDTEHATAAGTLLQLDDRQSLVDETCRLAVADHEHWVACVVPAAPGAPAAERGDDVTLVLPVRPGAATTLQLEVTDPSARGFDADARAHLADLAICLGAGLERLDLLERLDAHEQERVAERAAADMRADAIEGVFRTSVDGRVQLVNRAFAELAGYDSVDELLAGVSDVRHLYAEPAERRAMLADLRRAGRLSDYPLRLRRRDGSVRWVSLTGRIVGEGAQATLHGVVVDASDRKDTEDRLQAMMAQMVRRETMLHALSDNGALLLGAGWWEQVVPTVMASVAEAADASRVSLFVNETDDEGRRGARRRYRWVEPGLDDPLADNEAVQSFDFLQVGLASWVTALEAGETIAGLTTEFEAGPRAFLDLLGVRSIGAAPVHVDGEWWGTLVFDVAGQARPWDEREVEVLLTTARMLGAKIERDQAVAERARLAVIVDSSHDAILTRALDGTITTWNGGAEQIYGYPAEEAIGQNVAMLIPPERSADFDNVMGVAAGGTSVVAYPTERRRADGGRIHVAITAAPVLDEDGEVVAVASIERDVTSEVTAQQELARSNEELEQFAYVASHDLQEPLRMVASFVQLLERRYADDLDDTAREYIGFAVDGATRMQQLINDLLAFSRVTTRARPSEPIPMNDLVAEVLTDLGPAIEEAGAHVEVAELPWVSGDAGQLRQVVQNLVSNALKFRASEHQPHVRVSAASEGPGTWRLSVADDGIGIDAAHTQRVFAIFKRLHGRDEYAGTGIGLAVSKKIVERHGGRLWFESEPGHGTTFHFTVAADEEA